MHKEAVGMLDVDESLVVVAIEAFGHISQPNDINQEKDRYRQEVELYIKQCIHQYPPMTRWIKLNPELLSYSCSSSQMCSQNKLMVFTY